MVATDGKFCREVADGVAMGDEPHGDFEVHDIGVGCSDYRGSGHAACGREMLFVCIFAGLRAQCR